MKMTVLFGILALLAGCGEDREAQEDAAIAKAEAAIAELSSQLGAKLKHALGEGGPAAAIKVCSEVAQQISSEIGQKHGLTIRRTALRVRNTENAPDQWERKTLEMLEPHFNDPKSEVSMDGIVLADASEVRVLKPIRLQALCAMCHGTPERLDPEVKKTIEAVYPDDQAVGFHPGDLRGAFSVRVPLE